jgi:hypothetical protein
MRLYIVILIAFLFKTFTINAQASEKNVVKPDTITETIVYEYDTVYLAPDTIKLIDTIVNYLPAKKKLKPYNWTIGISFAPFISSAFNGQNVIDSFSLKQKLNYGIDFNVRLIKKGVIYGMDVGITPIREQLVFQYSSQASQQNNADIYDSLRISNNCTSTNYFNYLNANLFIGKKWRKANVFYGMNACFLTNILLGYKALLPINNPDNKIPSSMVKKLGFGVALNPNIGYRIGKNWEFYLSLLYRYTLNKESKYPQSNLRYMDIALGAGLNLIL